MSYQWVEKTVDGIKVENFDKINLVKQENKSKEFFNEDLNPQYIDKNAKGVNEYLLPKTESDLFTDSFITGHQLGGGWNGFYGRGILSEGLKGFPKSEEKFRVPSPELNFKTERVLNYEYNDPKDIDWKIVDIEKYATRDLITMESFQEAMTKANQQGLKATKEGVYFIPYFVPDIDIQFKYDETIGIRWSDENVDIFNKSKSGLQDEFSHDKHGDLTSNSGVDLDLRMGKDPIDPNNDLKSGIGISAEGINPDSMLPLGSGNKNILAENTINNNGIYVENEKVNFTPNQGKKINRKVIFKDDMPYSYVGKD